MHPLGTSLTTTALLVVGRIVLWQLPPLIQLEPNEQHPPPYADAHLNAEVDGQPREQQVARTVAVPETEVVYGHWYCAELQRLPQLEPMAQQEATKSEPTMQYCELVQQTEPPTSRPAIISGWSENKGRERYRSVDYPHSHRSFCVELLDLAMLPGSNAVRSHPGLRWHRRYRVSHLRWPGPSETVSPAPSVPPTFRTLQS